MSLRTTVGQLLVNSALPSQLRDYSRVLDKKSLGSLMDDVAKTAPKKYNQVVYELKKIGDETATRTGSSFSLKDFKSPFKIEPFITKVEEKATRILNSNKSQEEKNFAIAQMYEKLGDDIDRKLVKDSLAKGNNLAVSVISGARGKTSQLRSTIGAPILVTDHKDNPIPVPLTKSYAEGADPASYWAASYGTRKGVVATKFATAEAGGFGKQLTLAASNLVVTEKDCGTLNGVPYPAQDNGNLGCYLASSAGGYPRNTLVTPNLLASLKKKRVRKIVVRSPISCEAEKGVCQLCHGHTNTHQLPSLGDNVGIVSGSALAEPIAQGGMNTKHTGGVVGGVGVAGGFKAVSQLTTVPKIFQFGSTLAEEDGEIEDIREAAQGGTDILISGRKHYVPPGIPLKAEVGQKVERGYELSEGIINPRDIVRLKGIGAGRKHLASSLKGVYDNSVQGGIHRRNFENVARALINHVQVDDDEAVGDVLPDDIVDFQKVQKTYTPKGTQTVSTRSAKGKFLAEPYLHFTVGSRVDSEMIDELKTFGKTQIKVTDDPPPFSPVMLRLQDVPQAVTDWQARLAATHLQKGLLKSVHRGEFSSPHGISYIPALAQGREFGKNLPGQVGY